MEVETALKRSGRHQRRRDTDRRLTDTRDYFQHRRYSERADGIASAPRAELNAVRWQVKSWSRAGQLHPSTPGTSYCTSCSASEKRSSLKISARRRRGQVEEVPSGECRWQSPPSRPPVTGPMIEVEQLTKRFGPMLVLDRIDLCANRGRGRRLARANGAGKTTLVRVLTTLLKPDGDRHGSVLEGWLQPFARNQPLSVTIAAVRSLLEGGPAAHWVWQSVAWSVGLFAVFFGIALSLYRSSTS